MTLALLITALVAAYAGVAGAVGEGIDRYGKAKGWSHDERGAAAGLGGSLWPLFFPFLGFATVFHGGAGLVARVLDGRTARKALPPARLVKDAQMGGDRG